MGSKLNIGLTKGGYEIALTRRIWFFRRTVMKKGNILRCRASQWTKFCFWWKGRFKFTGSVKTPVNQIVSPTILGDLEFPNQEAAPFFTETKTPAVCLSLSTKAYRNQLDCDLRFLHVLVQSCTDKLKFFSLKDTVAATLEERVLLYLKNVCPRCEMDGVETAVFQLRCSRRQLQRVLKKLCEKGQLRRVGKGRYRLAT